MYTVCPASKARWLWDKYTMKKYYLRSTFLLLVTSILCDHILSQDHKYGYKIIVKQLETKVLVSQENNVKTSADRLG